MEKINPRIPLTEKTASQYATMDAYDGSMLYAIPYAGKSASYVSETGTDMLKTQLTIPYLMDETAFIDEDTLYCVAKLAPLLTSSEDLLTTSSGALLCAASDDLYQTELTGIKLLTKEQYDDLQTKDADTKYIVKDGDEVKEYLGTIFIK